MATATKAQKGNDNASKPTGKQVGLLTALGIEEPVSGDFFKPDTKWQTVTILGARLPAIGDDPRYYEETHEARKARASIWKNTERDEEDPDAPAWDPSGSDKQDRPKRLPILALVDVQQHGVDKVWEVTGVRAFHAVNSVSEVPADYRVRKVGKGTDTNVVIEPAPVGGDAGA